MKQFPACFVVCKTVGTDVRFNDLTDALNILHQMPCSHIVKENFSNRTCKSETLNIDFLVETGHT